MSDWDSEDEEQATRQQVTDDILARFESLAAGYRTVGNYDAYRGIQDLCDEIRKYGV